MADSREIGEHIATAAGLGMEFSGFSPPWVIVQLVIFLISTGLAVFDTYTDWEVVLDYKKDGFNNPLLPPNHQWYLAWLVFASIGTILTVISFLHDGIDLLYLMYKSYQKNCNERSYNITNPQAVTGDFEMKNKASSDITPRHEEETEHEIDEPCTCCYRCGWNGTTRNETLGTLTLWFQDFPMLALAVLYALSQTTCKTPEPIDTSKVYLDISISTSAAFAASSWRLLRSFVRLFISICVRMKFKSKRCLPHKGDSPYPPETCAQCCIIPFYIGLLFQTIAVISLFLLTFWLWLNYGIVKQGKNFDDSLGIYRYSVNNPDKLLFNISGTIFPSNNSYINLEKIPYNQQPFPHEVYCLSEFEYREEKSQIFFNAAEVQAVSKDGQFCITDDRPHSDNLCWIYYSFRNFSLYYASVNPTTGSLERFDEQCLIVSFRLNYRAVPVQDTSITVARHVNRTGFPNNGEPLVILNWAYNFYINVTNIFTAPNQIYKPLLIYQNVTCSFAFYYDEFDRRIHYNYRDVTNYKQPGCQCFGLLSCAIFYHRHLVYGYLTPDSRVIEYTHCSMLPREMLVPYYDPTLLVSCPC